MVIVSPTKASIYILALSGTVYKIKMYSHDNLRSTIDCILDIYKVKDSTVVVIAVCERKPGEELNVKRNVEVFRKIVPTIAKLACKAVLLVATQPIDVMSYITWKLSKFPSSRVLGTGTLLDSSRFQDLLSRKLGLARTSISCMNIGAQGDTSGICCRI